MLIFVLLLTMGITDVDSLPEPAGTIEGVVVNGTQGNQPLEGVAVVLRAGANGELVPVAETMTGPYGKFVFEQVPPDPQLVYLPGANRDGVHYPGRRVQLDSSNRVAQVTIVAYDVATAPCPLVAKRHEIDVTVEQQALRVRETLVIANPSRTTYVGQAMGSGPPVTLRLSIPENFDRVTFDKEFYGRRFWVVEHKPMTEIPWLPGEQELRFTYRVPLAERVGQFRRPLDVPSSDVRIRLHGAEARQVSCNLPVLREAGEHVVFFASAGNQLPEAFTIDLQIGSLPWPWLQYARWGALIALGALACATIAVSRLRGRPSKAPARVSRQQRSSRPRAA